MYITNVSCILYVQCAYSAHQWSFLLYLWRRYYQNKGPDYVASELHYSVTESVSLSVRHLEIFWNSCLHQNRNYTMIRFLHTMIHKYDSMVFIKATFPIRGHSYMECDKYVYWVHKPKHSRRGTKLTEQTHKKLSYQIIALQSDWILTKYVQIIGFSSVKTPQKICRIKIQSTRVLAIYKDSSRSVIWNTYNRSWESHVLVERISRRNSKEKWLLVSSSSCSDNNYCNA
jgi:hypothetical protein